jgi:hypothetical protein
MSSLILAAPQAKSQYSMNTARLRRRGVSVEKSLRGGK